MAEKLRVLDTPSPVRDTEAPNGSPQPLNV